VELDPVEVRAALDRLVAEFREVAGALVAELRVVEPKWDDAAGAECPEEIELGGITWFVDPHDPHYRFEDAAGGVIVEAHMYDPDRVDPYFLLLYAQTSGRHPVVVAAAPEGFADMCRLLDSAGIRYR
jgi:hypothetical protein